MSGTKIINQYEIVHTAICMYMYIDIVWHFSESNGCMYVCLLGSPVVPFTLLMVLGSFIM